MDRISEKVKDLIEVCSYKSLLDFTVDPSVTLESYHFTDITSQLMAAWLDSLVDLQSRKVKAKALAGYRGVGKSHFLAAFGAVISNPELRSLLSDAHVSASANHLMRRSYPVAFVKRGTADLLDTEIREAIALTMGCSTSDLPEGLEELFEHAEQFCGDLPLVIVIDTAFERDKRVARDDGVFLGQIAEAIKDKNVFIGVALDDDITEADGINSAIAHSYTIDYLDQEHLYKIVDTHIFRKHRQTESLIKDIYHQFREVLPAFRWSEPRFTSLYPLHPSILEIAPFVRLYAPDFALLGFASEAGARILGRPANSLIALDEVFDKVEDTLRKAPDLESSFETYDAISKEVVTSIPVMQRLQAKLILKALFILSLDGDGTTASEIAAAMLIFDEKDPSKSSQAVADLLESFVSFIPDSLNRKDEGDEVKYSFRVTGKDDLNSALAARVGGISDEVIPKILNRFAKDRFTDWYLTLNGPDEIQHWTDCHLTWRGGLRKGKIYWNWGTESNTGESNFDGFDVEITINAPGAEIEKSDSTTNSFQWIPDALTEEEIDTIHRYHLLLSDEELKSNYHEQVRAAGHSHAITVGKIWERVFLKDGSLFASGNEYPFADDSKDQQTVGVVLSGAIAAYFDTNYPDHPYFESTLEIRHVAMLVNDLFSGARVNNQEVQELARQFAEPLGIVELHDSNYVLVKEEHLGTRPFVTEILELVENAGSDTISLAEVYKTLKKAPFGLVREAQQLLIAALVAHRKVEFVTTKGDRIGRRSLDLKIIWDDIAGICKPADLLYSTERLNEWAGHLAGLESEISIGNAEERELVEAGVSKWIEDWTVANTVGRFRDLPDDILNTKIWHSSVNVERALGMVAETIQSFQENTISFEEMFERVADSFSDSVEEYRSRMNELESLRSFVDGVELREVVWKYLALCEITVEETIEDLRAQLFEIIESGFHTPTDAANKKLVKLWSRFKTAYIEYFSLRHDNIMKSHKIQEDFQEIKTTDTWWEFERLSKLPVFQRVIWNESKQLLRQISELDCSFDVRKQLETNPFCSCSFTLSRIEEWELLPDRLNNQISRGLNNYQNTLRMMKPDLEVSLKEFGKENSDPDLVKAAFTMLESLDNGTDIDFSDAKNLGILATICRLEGTSQMISAAMPDNSGIHSADNLRTSLNDWIDGLPADPILIKID